MRAAHGLDPRTSIFDVRVEPAVDALLLRGAATDAQAVTDLANRLREAEPRLTIHSRVTLLPEEAPTSGRHALVRAAVAPAYAEARLASPLVTQYVLGAHLEILARDGVWLRVRGDDGYIAWLHAGYVETGTLEWAERWRNGDGGEPAVSLGAQLEDDGGGFVFPLPWGARVIGEAGGRFRIPDGRRGRRAHGEIVAVDRLPDFFPARGESVARSAQRWIGTPYLWGGVTPGGADCSGFLQSVFRLHGTALPRDSDMQARVGEAVDPGEAFELLRAGDLLFFAERPERVTHVALSLGGARLIHCALANGSVAVNDLTGARPPEPDLRGWLSACRRVLPDAQAESPPRLTDRREP